MPNPNPGIRGGLAVTQISALIELTRGWGWGRFWKGEQTLYKIKTLGDRLEGDRCH